MLDSVINPVPRQVIGTQPDSLADILREDVNLAVWRRELSTELQHMVSRLLAGDRPINEVLVLQAHTTGTFNAPSLPAAWSQLDSFAALRDDLQWLVEAFACLLSAQRIGLRLRRLDTPMCPRSHVDQVAVRLICTYAGTASEWLTEGCMARHLLGQATAEPSDPRQIHALQAGDVALAKGERWLGNQGRGLVHRSPTPENGQSRLLLTLDWLA
ncbi:DUF1826 domain-containing protein [Pseudomonas fluvialis]|uniref:DUF1826 domain-containing protein n=1 Tax=Pseudomonas fluvialis TaxID=1793966 RepID=UPI0035B4EB02